MTNHHDKLNGGSVARLARYRRALADSLATIRGCRTPEAAAAFIESAGYTSPLNHRYSWMGDAHGPRFSDDGRRAYMPASVLDGFRDVGASHDIVRLRHTGWFKDADASETIAGHVWQLPARDGGPVYLAGYVEPDSGYCTLDAWNGGICVYGDKDDAARAADSLAERDAETEREHNERWHEARRVDESRDEKRDTLRAAHGEARGLVAVLRDLPQTADSRATICRMIRECRERMAAALRGIAEDTATLADFAADGVEV